LPSGDTPRRRAKREPKTPTNAAFRAWIRELRTGAGLSQSDLGNELGVSNRTVNRWETAGDEPGGLALIGLLRIAGHPVEEAIPEGISAPPSARIARLERACGDLSRRLDEIETRVRANSLTIEEHDVASTRRLRLILAALRVEDGADLERVRQQGERLVSALETLDRPPDARTRASDDPTQAESA
jgi:transcriptional regulator with XRE-family HTH domain